MKTALQQAIDLIEQKKHHRGPLYRAAMEDTITILTDLLPTERQIIEDAFNHEVRMPNGDVWYIRSHDTTSADYYDETFSTDKTKTDAN